MNKKYVCKIFEMENYCVEVSVKFMNYKYFHNVNEYHFIKWFISKLITLYYIINNLQFKKSFCTSVHECHDVSFLVISSFQIKSSQTKENNHTFRGLMNQNILFSSVFFFFVYFFCIYRNPTPRLNPKMVQDKIKYYRSLVS